MCTGREGQDAFQCMACGCHRSYHKSVRVGDNGKELDSGDASSADFHISLSRIESVALNLMEATGRALPLLAGELQRGSRGDDLAQKELDTVMKISIENLDHISKVTLSTVECIGILQTAGNSTQQSVNTNAARDHLRNLEAACVPDHGRLSSEISPVSTTERRINRPGHCNSQLSPSPGSQFPGNRTSAVVPHGVPNAVNHDTTTTVNPGGKPKRKRTQFTDEQRGKLKAYADHAGWTIVGQRKENIVAACQDIGILPSAAHLCMHVHFTAETRNM